MRRKALRMIVAAVAGAVLATVGVGASAVAETGGWPANAVTTYTPPAGNGGTAFGITQGPGGAWYAHGATVNRINTDRLDQFPIPGGRLLGWLAWDGTGSVVWFADRLTGRLGTVAGTGTVHEYQIPDGPAGTALPQAIVLGPGPDVWFTDQANNRIGRLDPATETFTMYPVPTPTSAPLGLTRGPDGALWFTERAAAKVGRMAPDGTFTEWALSPGAFPNRIVTGPDGAIWFTELLAGKLGRIDMTGQLTETPIAGGPVGITVGADGRLYTALDFTNQLAQLDTTGAVTATWPLPGSGAAVQVSPSRDSIWVTDSGGDHVYRVRTACSVGVSLSDGAITHSSSRGTS
jgi:virginiamycin B lyase